MLAALTWPSSSAISVRVAIAAIWASGWLTVVSGGDTQLDVGRSSKPTTLRSSGMRRSSRRAAS